MHGMKDEAYRLTRGAKPAGRSTRDEVSAIEDLSPQSGERVWLRCRCLPATAAAAAAATATTAAAAAVATPATPAAPAPPRPPPPPPPEPAPAAPPPATAAATTTAILRLFHRDLTSLDVAAVDL